MASAISTRSKCVCPIFGSFDKFKETLLPTYSDVLKHFLWVQRDLLLKGNNKSPAVDDICAIVRDDLKAVWNKASVPSVSDQEIFRLIKNYYLKYKNLKKTALSRKKSHESRKRFQTHAERSLFDIAICKCSNFQLCKCRVKIPRLERMFLVDQRNLRQMRIIAIDFCYNKAIEKKFTRKVKNEGVKKRASKENCTPQISDVSTSPDDSDALEKSPDDDYKDTPYIERKIQRELVRKTLNFDKNLPSVSKSQNEKNKESSVPQFHQLRVVLPSLATACDRTGVSDRSAAIIASSVLKDFGVVSQENSVNVIDRSKVRRERKRVRNQLQKDSVDQNATISALYFDGRKDSTLVRENKKGSFYRATKVEEHIVLLAKPDSIFLGHASPISGTSANISSGIIEFLTENAINLSKLIAVGCDGTNVNTGNKNGIISQLELFVGHKLHWFVCLLHVNELPLRHLFQAVDGKTSGPNGFSGPIGKALPTCETLDVIKYVPIRAALPEIDANDLSSDQKYLYDICRAVSSGVFPVELANRTPGKMAHSRWVTTANRILRLYVATIEPLADLRLLAEFIMRVYAQSWFEIKRLPTVANGPHHLHGMIKKCSYLPNNYKKNCFRRDPKKCFFCTS
jgi:hypothetical protein